MACKLNAIAFFASEHERLTQKPLAVSSLHTYLTLLDHMSLEKVGRPVFGRHFRRMGKTLTDPLGRQETPQDDGGARILKEGEKGSEHARRMEEARPGVKPGRASGAPEAGGQSLGGGAVRARYCFSMFSYCGR